MIKELIEKEIIDTKQKLICLEKQLEKIKKEEVVGTISSGDVFNYPFNKSPTGCIIVINTVNGCDKWNIFGLCGKIVPFSNFTYSVTLEKIKDHIISHNMVRIGNINTCVYDFIGSKF